LRNWFGQGQSAWGKAGAKKTHCSTQKARRFKPSLELLEDRVVPSLTPVSPYAGYLYSAVVEVHVWFLDGKSYVGSGAMIDSFHVLTAAHMLYSYADGGWATMIQVIPNMYNSSDPYGVAYR
jgi:hypothetical protein